MLRGTIDQRFCALEGYYITQPVFALCKPHKYRLFITLNAHASNTKCKEIP